MTCSSVSRAQMSVLLPPGERGRWSGHNVEPSPALDVSSADVWMGNAHRLVQLSLDRLFGLVPSNDETFARRRRAQVVTHFIGRAVWLSVAAQAPAAAWKSRASLANNDGTLGEVCVRVAVWLGQALLVASIITLLVSACAWATVDVFANAFYRSDPELLQVGESAWPAVGWALVVTCTLHAACACLVFTYTLKLAGLFWAGAGAVAALSGCIAAQFVPCRVRSHEP